MSNPLPDLRPGLEVHLAANEAKGKALEVEFDHEIRLVQDRFKIKSTEINKERELLRAMLDAENKRLGMDPTELSEPSQHASLGDFFLDVLRSMGPKNKDQLRGLARSEGFFADDDAGGRATNITLANFVRGNRLMVDVDGNYSLSEQVVANTEERIRRL